MLGQKTILRIVSRFERGKHYPGFYLATNGIKNRKSGAEASSMESVRKRFYRKLSGKALFGKDLQFILLSLAGTLRFGVKSQSDSAWKRTNTPMFSRAS